MAPVASLKKRAAAAESAARAKRNLLKAIDQCRAHLERVGAKDRVVSIASMTGAVGVPMTLSLSLYNWLKLKVHAAEFPAILRVFGGYHDDFQLVEDPITEGIKFSERRMTVSKPDSKTLRVIIHKQKESATKPGPAKVGDDLMNVVSALLEPGTFSPQIVEQFHVPLTPKLRLLARSAHLRHITAVKKMQAYERAYNLNHEIDLNRGYRLDPASRDY